MFLSDADILEKIVSGEICILDPTGESVIDTTTKQERDPGQLQNHGYDLRAEKYHRWGDTDWVELKTGEKIEIKPHETLVISTYERLKLKPNISGTVHTRARNTLLGLAHISTTIHAGWANLEEKGLPLYLGVCNLSKTPFLLEKHDPICRVLFYELKTPAKSPPPSLKQVEKDFADAKSKMAKSYSRSRTGWGWAYIVFSTVAAVIVLVLVQSYLPQYGSIAIPLVVSLLTVTIAFIRRRFSLLF